VQDTFITYQVTTFAVTMGMGILAGLLYDTIRAVRYYFKPSRTLLFFIDLFFWFVVTLAVFAALLASNWGEVRAYVFIGLGFGALFYVQAVSGLFYRAMVRLLLLSISAMRTALTPVGRTVRLGKALAVTGKRKLRVKVDRGRQRAKKIKAKFHKRKKE